MGADTNTTRHRLDCRRAWRHLDPRCPRCQELAAGAAPRDGWTTRRDHFAAERIAAIRSHNCTASGCGAVCTFGDW